MFQRSVLPSSGSNRKPYKHALLFAPCLNLQSRRWIQYFPPQHEQCSTRRHDIKFLKTVPSWSLSSESKILHEDYCLLGYNIVVSCIVTKALTEPTAYNIMVEECYPENGCSKFCHNVDNYLPDCLVSQSRRH